MSTLNATVTAHTNLKQRKAVLKRYTNPYMTNITSNWAGLNNVAIPMNISDLSNIIHHIKLECIGEDITHNLNERVLVPLP